MKRVPNPLSALAVIIPLASDEEAWLNLVPDLRELPLTAEIILVSPEPMPREFESLTHDTRLAGRVRWLYSDVGRAGQLNAGARATQKKFLWFLHADSHVSPEVIAALRHTLERHSDDLLYFTLRFLSDGPPVVMRINEIGCWIRSRVMGVPFGDQGFCLSRANFDRVGAFPEGLPYGEDHLFVWRARQQGISLRCTGEALLTSARRYRDEGWCQLTWSYAHRWIRQALPEWLRLKGLTS